jgi:predicted DNA-binding transcriptional regulator AlpA
MEYLFVLRYQLAFEGDDPAPLVDQLAAAGCDDALVGIGQRGRLALDFSREAESAEAALLSALEDVHGAVPSARLIEVSPDLVGLTDVADAVGMSRQNMRKLMLAHAAGFPTPVHEGSASLWHLADVLDWLQAKGGYAVSDTLHEISRAALQVNVMKESARVAGRVSPQRRGPSGVITDREVHDNWFRAKVHQALADSGPAAMHQQVMEDAQALIDRRRRARS